MALELKPSAVGIHKSRRDVYLAQNQWDKAIEDYSAEVASGLEGDYARLYSLRAASYPQTKEGKQAREADVEKALDYLEQASSKRFLDSYFLETRDFEVLKENPRFNALARRRP